MNTDKNQLENETPPAFAKPMLADGFIKQSVADFEKLDNEIRKYLYPIVYKMYEDNKLNKGRLPNKKAIDAVEIIEFCLNEDKVSVHVSIHWRGDCCDDEWVSV